MKPSLCALCMFLILACSNSEQPTNDRCIGDHAEFQFNGDLFHTSYEPNGGEILNREGDNCGVGATLNESANILTLRIFGDEQDLNISAEIKNQSDTLDIRHISFTDDTQGFSFSELDLNFPNYIILEYQNNSEQVLEGRFNFSFKNIIGPNMLISDGFFNCSYHKF